MYILTTLPAESFVTAAFAELLSDVQGFLDVATDRQERAFWRRQITALNKAQFHWVNGVRPQLTTDAYLMPSATSNGLNVYRLTRLGGVLHCDCKAGQNGILCYHHMLINVIERAAELERAERNEEEISGGSEPTPETAAQLLNERLAATAAIVDAMRQAQQRPPLDYYAAKAATEAAGYRPRAATDLGACLARARAALLRGDNGWSEAA